MMEAPPTVKAPPTPPYIAYSTFRTLLKSFQEHGVPGRIDRSVLTNFSGSVGGQIIPAMKFLRLIDQNNHPTEWLRGFMSTFGTDDWPRDLQHLLEEAYEPLSKLNLQTASPSQFDEAFSKAYPGTEDVMRKCKTFYLAAAANSKIPISPYILRNKKPRSAPTKKRGAKTNGGKTETPVGVSPPIVPSAPQSQAGSLSQQLLAELNPEKMSEEETSAIWVLLKYLRKEGK